MGNNMLTGIISISVGAVLLANVFISTIKGTNTSGHGLNTSPIYNCALGTSGNCSFPDAWTTAELSMFGLLTLIGIVGLVYGVLSVFGLA